MIVFDKEGETLIDDISGLKLEITTRKELDEAEAQNILKAYVKYTLNSSKLKNVTFDLNFFRKLHKEMFSDVWNWAGEFRTTQTSIGVEATKIYLALYQLQDDLKFWKENWNYMDTAVRLHHSLVKIHPFLNGNGRWARLVVDLWLLKNGHNVLSWGSNLDEISTDRSRYISALQEADNGNYQKLKEFMFIESKLSR